MGFSSGERIISSVLYLYFALKWYFYNKTETTQYIKIDLS